MPDEPLRIGHPPRGLRHEAFMMALCDLPAEERAAHMAPALGQVNRCDSEAPGLFAAMSGSRVAGAVFARIRPGNTAAIWPPRLADGVPVATADSLMGALCEWLEGEGVTMAQTVLPTVSEMDRRALDSAQFTHLSDLLYLVVAQDQFPKREPLGPLRFVPVPFDNHAQLTRMVEATYEATRDCPGLDGVRDINHVLAGYRRLGDPRTSAWLLVRWEHDDVGCLILADHPQYGNLELVYMGVAPSYRGRGWGTEIAQWAQWQARLLGRERLVLAVDADNAPALAAYVAAGFRAWDRRSAYIRVFRKR